MFSLLCVCVLNKQLSNVYTIISPGGDGTEAIVIHAPIQSDNVIGIAAAMVLGRHIRGMQPSFFFKA